jgi:hypothetical protein
MAKKKGTKTPHEFRGQLMLQTSAGRYFRDGVEIGEHIHRRAVYSNAWLIDPDPIDLPVGKLIPGTDNDDVIGHMIEAVDRLERERPDGTDDFVVATGGNELIDDVAYVLTFVLNRTFTRDHDQIRRLVPHFRLIGRHRAAASLFPQLFEPRAVIQPEQITEVVEFMTNLLELHREDFARVMRVIRSSVDATRRALDDATGAYTDLVAALESIADDEHATPTTWDRYDGRKRKIFNKALKGESPEMVEKVQQAVLEADRAGLKRRFVASTMARITPDYYRTEATNALRPPASADIERMLGIAYDIRSRRSHILQDLGEEAWVFSDGAEVAYEPSFDRIYTLAGLWRLTRHVVQQYVKDTPKVDPEPWDYRMSLPGIITGKLAPQYWIWHDLDDTKVDAADIYRRFDGVVDAFIAWHSGNNDEGFNLDRVSKQIEQVVPTMPDSDAKTTLIAIHRLWHEWGDPATRTPEAAAFVRTYEAHLQAPSVIAFAVALLSNFRTREWTPREWADLATARRAARINGKTIQLTAKIDALLQLEAADQMEGAGQHDEAVIFAANAVEEYPGDKQLLTWEAHLISGAHGPDFQMHGFLFDGPPSEQHPAVPEGDTVTTQVEGSK